MTAHIPDSLERFTQADLIGVVRELFGEVGRLRAENEKLEDALAKLSGVKDGLARLEHPPPGPLQKPSGMDKATDEVAAMAIRSAPTACASCLPQMAIRGRPIGRGRLRPPQSECPLEYRCWYP
jgi:hypothetical protein